MPNAHNICRELGIILHSKSKMHPGELPPKHTWSRQAIVDVSKSAIKREINLEIRRQKPKTNQQRASIVSRVRSHFRGGREPNHVYNMLTLLLSSEETSKNLYGDVITGVSFWGLVNEIKSEEIPFLTSKFGELDLKGMRSIVHELAIPRRPSQIGFLIAEEMQNRLKEIR